MKLKQSSIVLRYVCSFRKFNQHDAALSLPHIYKSPHQESLHKSRSFVISRFFFLVWQKSVGMTIGIHFIYVVEGIEIGIASLPARKGTVGVYLYRDISEGRKRYGIGFWFIGLGGIVREEVSWESEEEQFGRYNCRWRLDQLIKYSYVLTWTLVCECPSFTKSC